VTGVGIGKVVDRAMEKDADGTIFIGAGVEFKGEMTVPGSASVDGKFEGVLKAKNLIVGQTGHVSGQISAETAEIRGAVGDHLTVQSKLILRSSGSISGTISYAKIMVEEGGELAGTIEVISSPLPRTEPASAEPKVLQFQQSGE
jgi:cytoskeletal protein CcmA (bactofilin family)